MKKRSVGVLVCMLLLAANILGVILYMGLFQAHFLGEPDEASFRQAYPAHGNAEILDTFQAGDSLLLLLKEGKSIALLQLQRNLLLPRYRITDWKLLGDPESYDHVAHIRTVTASYDAALRAGDQIRPEGPVDTGFRLLGYWKTYGMVTAMACCAEYAAWCFLKLRDKKE